MAFIQAVTVTLRRGTRCFYPRHLSFGHCQLCHGNPSKDYESTEYTAPLGEYESDEYAAPPGEHEGVDEIINNVKGKTKAKFDRLDDSSIARLARSLYSSKRRAIKGCMLLDGLKNIKDAFEAGYVPKALLVQRSLGDDALVKVRARSVPKDKQLEVTYTQMKTLCNTQSPQPLAAILDIPKIKDLCDMAPGTEDTETRELRWLQQGEYSRWAWVSGKTTLECYTPRIPLILVCDGVRDPSNLGTILLSAAAVGCQLVVCMQGCTDVWNPKVLRAAAGAHLRMPVLNGVSWSFMEEICSRKRRAFLAYHSLEAMIPAGLTLLPTERLHQIRQFLRRLPKQQYHDVNWKCDAGGVLIVGGTETGHSLNAVDFAQRRTSQQVCVPTTDGISRLSMAMTTTVILFSALTKFEKLLLNED